MISRLIFLENFIFDSENGMNYLFGLFPTFFPVCKALHIAGNLFVRCLWTFFRSFTVHRLWNTCSDINPYTWFIFYMFHFCKKKRFEIHNKNLNEKPRKYKFYWSPYWNFLPETPYLLITVRNRKSNPHIHLQIRIYPGFIHWCKSKYSIVDFICVQLTIKNHEITINSILVNFFTNLNIL